MDGGQVTVAKNVGVFDGQGGGRIQQHIQDAVVQPLLRAAVLHT